MKYIYSTIILVFYFINCLGQGNDYKTLVYFENDSLSLELDLFIPGAQVDENRPLMIFVHGGGFKNGDKGGGHDLGRYLSGKGIITASINYTLYMKDQSFGCDGILAEKVKAIQIAANQLWLATNFFIQNAQKFKVDTSKIFISGSSAGAETVLHAAFWDRMLMDMYGQNLPEDFKYRGLVSGAGALMDINLVKKSSIIPVMFFHGNGDELVPYGTASHHYCPTNSPGWLMLFGAYPLYQRACDLGSHSVLYTFCGGGHENANTFYHGNMEPVYLFIQNVLKAKKSQEHFIISTGKSNELSREYGFCD